MYKIISKSMVLIAMILVAVFLCSCERVVDNCGDELVMSSWCSKSENGNTVTLTFCDDNAKLELKASDDSKTVIEGLCELSADTFIIHDTETHTSFLFEYSLDYNAVDIIYEGEVLTLSKL